MALVPALREVRGDALPDEVQAGDFGAALSVLSRSLIVAGC